MNRHLKTLICFFALYTCFGISFLDAQQKNFYFYPVSIDNFEYLMTEIEAYYSPRYGDDDDLMDTPEAMHAIRQLLYPMLQTEVSVADCNPGKLYPTEIELRYGEHDRSTLNFRWRDGDAGSEEYFGVALDFRNGQTSFSYREDAGVSLQVTNLPKEKFYAINSRCGDKQSPYYIIIIERDMNLDSFPDSGDDSLPPPTLRKTEVPQNNLSLEVFPNPISSRSQVNLNLPKAENCSLSLLDGRTGAMMKTFFPKRLLDSGKHSQLLIMEDITPGVYYLVLQTDTERRIHRIVKI